MGCEPCQRPEAEEPVLQQTAEEKKEPEKTEPQPKPMTPAELKKMQGQVQAFGAEFKNGAEVTALKKLDNDDIQITCDKDKYVARSVILTPGSDYRKLDIAGEDKFRNAGAGVSYCGTCGAPFSI